jgi:hypothetical protein
VDISQFAPDPEGGSMNDRRGVGIAMGIAIGAAIGVAEENGVIGIAVGLAIGVGLGELHARNSSDT